MPDALGIQEPGQGPSDHEVTFPDNLTEVSAEELPIGCSGYVDDYAVAIGVGSIDYSSPIGRDLEVYGTPAPGRRATLKRDSTDGFTFVLPPGDSWGGRSRFPARFPNPLSL